MNLQKLMGKIEAYNAYDAYLMWLLGQNVKPGIQQRRKSLFNDWFKMPSYEITLHKRRKKVKLNFKQMEPKPWPEWWSDFMNACYTFQGSKVHSCSELILNETETSFAIKAHNKKINLKFQ